MVSSSFPSFSPISGQGPIFAPCFSDDVDSDRNYLLYFQDQRCKVDWESKSAASEKSPRLIKLPSKKAKSDKSGHKVENNFLKTVHSPVLLSAKHWNAPFRIPIWSHVGVSALIWSWADIFKKYPLWKYSQSSVEVGSKICVCVNSRKKASKSISVWEQNINSNRLVLVAAGKERINLRKYQIVERDSGIAGT